MSLNNRAERLKTLYPLHWHVWHNDFRELEKALKTNKVEIEKRDPRGRTALMLSVALGHLESTKVLLNHNATVGVEDLDGFTVVHEAVSTGDPELLQEVLERRDYQRHYSRIGGIPELLKRIRETPDFYVEMKWEFTSWVPLVSRMCPSDTYKVYKSGSCVRIDTTLLGFDQASWQRGSRSFIFKGHDETAVMMEVDHEAGQVFVEQMRVLPPEIAEFTGSLRPSTKAIAARLTSPIVTTYVDTEKISFERNKSGIWGWRSDKFEMVNNCNCKVFSANNVELVTRTRTEHLTDADKNRQRLAKSPIQSFLGMVETQDGSGLNANNIDTNNAIMNGMPEEENRGNPCNLSVEDYLDDEVDLNGQDVGRPKEVNSKVQKFKATLWLCEEYPLSLQEQILPIVDLMAISSTHFAKLRDFITLQLPSGFPVKIEIPLFHVLNARITFGNIFALDEEVQGVTPIKDPDVAACVLDDSCFEPPSGYVRLGGDEPRQSRVDEEDELLQFAIQQSLMEAGSEEDQVTIWEALRAERPPTNLPLHASDEERDLQRAIQESMCAFQASQSDLSDSTDLAALNNASSPLTMTTTPSSRLGLTPTTTTEDINPEEELVIDEYENISAADNNTTSPTSLLLRQDKTVGLTPSDSQLQLALKLSQQYQEEEELRRQEEEEMLNKILELSLTEK